jgi:hypothetical protein
MRCEGEVLCESLSHVPAGQHGGPNGSRSAGAWRRAPRAGPEHRRDHGSIGSGRRAERIRREFPAEIELASLRSGDGSAGFVLNGIAEGDLAGVRVSAAGDVDGDGVDDLLVGASGVDPAGRAGAGAGYVVFGRDTAAVGSFPAEFELSSLLPGAGGDGSSGFVLNGINVADGVGAVSDAGDPNGDGVDDLIIGSAGVDPGGRSRAGAAYVVFGRDTAAVGSFSAEFELSSLLPGAGGDGSSGFVLNGIDADDRSGSALSGGGDFNGDGVDDLIDGAIFADPDGRNIAGESYVLRDYVVFGRDTAAAGSFPAELELSSLLSANGGDGSAGFVLNGKNAEDRSGSSVSEAGDVTGDGIGDFIIGAYWAGEPGDQAFGESYVVFGRDTSQTGNFPAAFNFSRLFPGNGGDGSSGFVIVGLD